MAEGYSFDVSSVEMDFPNDDTVLLAMSRDLKEFLQRLKHAGEGSPTRNSNRSFAELKGLIVSCLENKESLPEGVALTLRCVRGQNWEKPLQHLVQTIDNYRPSAPTKSRESDFRARHAFGSLEEHRKIVARDKQEYESLPEVRAERESRRSVQESARLVVDLFMQFRADVQGHLVGQKGVTSTGDPDLAEGVIARDLQNEEDTVNWSEASSDLQFDEDRWMVRRASTGDKVGADTKMDFSVLKFIAEKGPRFTSRRDLEDNWQRLGGISDGGTAVDSRLNRIRTKLLYPLGLKLNNRLGVGWRVVDKEDSC